MKKPPAAKTGGPPVYGHNIGTKFDYGSKELTGPGNLTLKDGNFRRLVGDLSDSTKFGVQTPPPGYLPVEPGLEVPVVIQLGQARGEHVFKFRRIRWAVRVEPEKKKIMLGEPRWLIFTVKNATNETRGLELGGEYRNRLGRPETFEVTVIDNDAKQMPIPDAGQSMGGISWNEALKPNGEAKVRLFLSDWATITQPGSYRVFVKVIEQMTQDSSQLVRDVALRYQKELAEKAAKEPAK